MKKITQVCFLLVFAVLILSLTGSIRKPLGKVGENIAPAAMAVEEFTREIPADKQDVWRLYAKRNAVTLLKATLSND